jgi:hypothetical protein
MSNQKTGFVEIVRGLLAVQEDGSNIKIGTQTSSASGLALAAGTPGAILPAGTATVAPLVLTSGTNLTTAAAGAIEYDGTLFYATAVASTRQLIDTIQYQSLVADYTLADSASAQAAFNGTAAGAVTLPGSTGYMVDAIYYLTNTGTSSHTWGILFAGGATITAAGTALMVDAYTATSNALTAKSSIYIVGAGISSVTAVTAASTSATENVVIRISGRININAGGTLIPQIKASAQPTGTEKMLAGSYIALWPIGSNTATNVGNWS